MFVPGGSWVRVFRRSSRFRFPVRVARMTVSAPAAVALMRIQVNASAPISFRLRDDKPPINAWDALRYIHARWQHEKPAVTWGVFAERVMQECVQ